MDLRTYLFKNLLSVKEFSEIVGTHRTYISQIIHGKKIPGIKLAKSIEKATNHQVKAIQFINKKIKKYKSQILQMDFKEKES